ncbi:hypothetical protein B5P40_20725 [Bacillus sp. SRB_8]|nr:hypothetical protein B5P40_20725 [Bacillus sp. SRB_8]
MVLPNCHQVKKFIVPQNEKNELNPHRQVWRDKIFVLGLLQNIRLMGMGFSRDTCKNGSYTGFYFHDMTHLFFIQVYSLLWGTARILTFWSHSRIN